jgi:hypothetical protein
MTETEWLASDNPNAMLRHLRHKVGLRKLRLFSCACCRRIWHQIPEPWRRAVELSERYVEGEVRERELTGARPPYPAVWSPGERVAWCVTAPGKELRTLAFFDVCYSAALAASGARTMSGTPDPAELAAQAVLVREVFGNPFRTAEMAWQQGDGGLASRFARSIYEERAFDRMPILADALEDAGCADAAVLGHLRSPGPHVRGCWVIDSLTGRE